MDCYENDFIDDTDVIHQRAQLKRKHQLRKELTPRKRRPKVLDASSDSDSERESVAGGSCNQGANARRIRNSTTTLGTPKRKRLKKAIVDSSSDSSVDAVKQTPPSQKSSSVSNIIAEETGHERVKRTDLPDWESDDDKKLFRRASSSSRTAKLELLSSSSSEENGAMKKTPMRRRRVKFSPDSDNDLPVRYPTVRDSRLLPTIPVCCNCYSRKSFLVTFTQHKALLVNSSRTHSKSKTEGNR